jgi:hypothetical protein
MSLSMASAAALMPPSASLAFNSGLYAGQPAAAQAPAPTAAQLPVPASPRGGNGLQTQGSGASAEAEMLTSLMGEIQRLKAELGGGAEH